MRRSAARLNVKACARLEMSTELITAPWIRKNIGTGHLQCYHVQDRTRKRRRYDSAPINTLSGVCTRSQRNNNSRTIVWWTVVVRIFNFVNYTGTLNYLKKSGKTVDYKTHLHTWINWIDMITDARQGYVRHYHKYISIIANDFNGIDRAQPDLKIINAIRYCVDRWPRARWN